MDGELLYDGVYRFADYGPMGQVYVYLIIGRDRALLIDSGYGGKRWDKLVAKYTDKPVTVLITHAHIDHALGARFFQDAYVHEADEKVWYESNDKAFLARVLSTFSMPDCAESEREFLLSPETVVQADRPLPRFFLGRTEFDVGDRKISLVHTPGHSQGCCCFIDEKKGVCFTGDTLSKYVWLQLRESTTLAVFEDSLRLLKTAFEKHGVTTIYPAHGEKMPAIETIEKYFDLIGQIRKGTTFQKPLHHPLVPGIRHVGDGVSLILNDPPRW
ncbi:MAG: MBL fold metallo-hydrolase [Clostridia bacterium]|nr:MBL fold metallo-hydrolase [Clostridia bacterium]